MYKTLQNLQNLIDPKMRSLSLDEIAQSYRASLNPSLLALAYEKTFPLLLQTGQRYFGLTLEDLASYALQELDYSLISYKPGKGSFLSYSLKVYSNRLREATIENNQHKRKANFYCDDWETSVACSGATDANMQDAELRECLKQCKLTERQFTYCQYVMEGWTSRCIADVMGITPQRMSQMRSSIRKKLQPLVYE